MRRKFSLRKLVDMYTTWCRLQEAKRALINIPHAGECDVFGTGEKPGEPESCFHGDAARRLLPCLRTHQWARIRYLERALRRVTTPSNPLGRVPRR